MTKIINLTPHKVVINDGTIFEPSGTVARVAVHQVPDGEVNGIPVMKQTFGQLENLPEPQDNTIYIVSQIVLSAAKELGRTDCVAPDTANAVRDEEGRIVSVPGFVR